MRVDVVEPAICERCGAVFELRYVVYRGVEMQTFCSWRCAKDGQE